MARRPFSSGLQAGARSASVVAPLVNPAPIVVAQAGPSPTPMPPGTQAPLPTYTNDNPPPTPDIGVYAPAGASPAYNVTYQIGAGAWVTANVFPFVMNMASDSQTFNLYANDSGKTQSDIDTQSWNSLFL